MGLLDVLERDHKNQINREDQAQNLENVMTKEVQSEADYSFGEEAIVKPVLTAGSLLSYGAGKAAGMFGLDKEGMDIQGELEQDTNSLIQSAYETQRETPSGVRRASLGADIVGGLAPGIGASVSVAKATQAMAMKTLQKSFSKDFAKLTYQALKKPGIKSELVDDALAGGAVGTLQQPEAFMDKDKNFELSTNTGKALAGNVVAGAALGQSLRLPFKVYQGLKPVVANKKWDGATDAQLNFVRPNDLIKLAEDSPGVKVSELSPEELATHESTDNYFVFEPNDGDFKARLPEWGYMEGNMDLEGGGITLDMTSSNINPKLKTTGIGGQAMLEPLDAAVATTGSTQGGKASAYSLARKNIVDEVERTNKDLSNMDEVTEDTYSQALDELYNTTKDDLNEIKDSDTVAKDAYERIKRSTDERLNTNKKKYEAYELVLDELTKEDTTFSKPAYNPDIPQVADDAFQKMQQRFTRDPEMRETIASEFKNVAERELTTTLEGIKVDNLSPEDTTFINGIVDDINAGDMDTAQAFLTVTNQAQDFTKRIDAQRFLKGKKLQNIEKNPDGTYTAEWVDVSVNKEALDSYRSGNASKNIVAEYKEHYLVDKAFNEHPAMKDLNSIEGVPEVKADTVDESLRVWDKKTKGKGSNKTEQWFARRPKNKSEYIENIDTKIEKLENRKVELANRYEATETTTRVDNKTTATSKTTPEYKEAIYNDINGINEKIVEFQRLKKYAESSTNYKSLLKYSDDKAFVNKVLMTQESIQMSSISGFVNNAYRTLENAAEARNKLSRSKNTTESKNVSTGQERTATYNDVLTGKPVTRTTVEEVKVWSTKIDKSDGKTKLTKADKEIIDALDDNPYTKKITQEEYDLLNSGDGKHKIVRKQERIRDIARQRGISPTQVDEYTSIPDIIELPEGNLYTIDYNKITRDIKSSIGKTRKTIDKAIAYGEKYKSLNKGQLDFLKAYRENLTAKYNNPGKIANQMDEYLDEINTLNDEISKMYEFSNEVPVNKEAEYNRMLSDKKQELSNFKNKAKLSNAVDYNLYVKDSDAEIKRAMNDLVDDTNRFKSDKPIKDIKVEKTLEDVGINYSHQPAVVRLGSQKRVHGSTEAVNITWVEKIGTGGQTGWQQGMNVKVTTTVDNGLIHTKNIFHEIGHAVDDIIKAMDNTNLTLNKVEKTGNIIIERGKLIQQLKDIPELHAMVMKNKPINNDEYLAYALGEIFGNDASAKNTFLRREGMKIGDIETAFRIKDNIPFEARLQEIDDLKVQRTTLRNQVVEEAGKISELAEQAELTTDPVKKKALLGEAEELRQEADYVSREATIQKLTNQLQKKNESLYKAVDTDNTIITDILSFVKDNLKDDAKFALDQYERGLFQHVNASPKAKAILAGEQLETWNPALTKMVLDSTSTTAEYIGKVSDMIDNMSLLEIFKMDAYREVVESVAANKIGFENALISSVSKITDEFKKSHRKFFPTSKAANDAEYYFSRAIALGLHNLELDKLGSLKKNSMIGRDMVVGYDKIPEYIRSDLDVYINKIIDDIAYERTIGKTTANSLEGKNKIIKKMTKLGLDSSVLKNDIAELIDGEVSTRRTLRFMSNNNKQYVDSVFDSLRSNPKAWKSMKNTWIDHEATLKRAGAYENQFGVNPDFRLKHFDYKMKIVTRAKMNQKVIKTFDGGLKLVYEDVPDVKHGQQDSILAEFISTKDEKGIYEAYLPPGKVKKDKAGNFYVQDGKKRVKVDQKQFNIRWDKQKNRWTLKYKINTDDLFRNKLFGNSSDFADTRVSTMFQRNIYNVNGKTMVNGYKANQMNKLIDNGVFLTESHLRSLDDITQEKYFEIDIPDYGTYYAPERFRHQFKGTKGFDFGQVSKAFGKYKYEVDRYIIRPLLGIANILKGVLLNYNLASHINSSISSWAIYYTHANNLNGRQLKSQAKTELASYKLLLEKAGRMQLDGKSNKAIMAELQKNPLHFAINNGLGATLRGDTLNLNAYKENQLMKSLRPMFKDKQAYEALKNWFGLPDSRWGNAAGEWFDETELIPKFALYLDGLNSGMTQSSSMQKTLMAYPNYGMNLHPALKMFDLVSPYTKFATQYPKMLYSASKTNRLRLGLISATYVGGIHASYALRDESSISDEFFNDEGFAKISDNAYWYVRSLDPYMPPFSMDEIGNVSVWSNLDRLLFPFDINPVTISD